METAAKALLGAAVALAALGLAALVLARLGLDRLPGTWERRIGENGRVIVPVGAMIVVSLVGTIVLNLIARR